MPTRKTIQTGLFAFLAGFALLLIESTPVTARAERLASRSDPVVLELFTSQGCSSCPPADRLMAELAKNAGLLVMTRPVTYWDRLGWKDTLARPENTSLQRAYAAGKRKGAGVYTPQVVVNGGDATVGSRKAEILALARTARSGAQLVVRKSARGGLGVGVSGLTENLAELVVVALDSSERVAIGRGENSGRTVTYTNVVRDEQRLAVWRGGTEAFPIPASLLDVPKADRFALILREPDGGPILAARMLP